MLLSKYYKTRQRGAACLAGVLLVAAIPVHAQFSYDYRKAADNYYNSGNYASAVTYYEKYLTGGKNNTPHFDPYHAVVKKSDGVAGNQQQALYQLAESWRQLKNYEKAAPLYKQLIEYATAFPLASYHYATCLRALADYAGAEKALHNFLNAYEKKDAFAVAAQREIKNLVYIQEQLQKKTSAYTIQPLADGKTGASYAPVQLNDQKVLFTATWADSNATDRHINRLYQATYTNGVLATTERATSLKGLLQEGAATVSADGNTLYLTRWLMNKQHKQASIYRSTRVSAAEGWQEPVALDTLVNVPGANTQQPFIMPDGKYLLYASDKPGGAGGFDLWMAELDASGKTIRTTNMGNSINTAFNEQAPSYHTGSGTLVFATDGRTGMGGYDLFYSKGVPGKWAEPENFGYPVNSVKDDMYFTSLGKTTRILEEALISSDRADVCCLELFQVKKAVPEKLVIGQVVACDTRTPLAGVQVEVTDTVTGVKLYSGKTDDDGRYAFTVKQELPLSSVAAANGYHTTTRSVQLMYNEEADSLVSTPLCMEKVATVIEEVQVLKNVYYEFGKAELKAISFASLDEVVMFLNKNPQLKVEIGGHTDNKGSDELNLKLSEARAANVVAYLVSKGIDKDRLTAKGYGASIPLASNTKEDGSDNPEGREKNRRTEMKVLK